jgi:hypothetical protein
MLFPARCWSSVCTTGCFHNVAAVGDDFMSATAGIGFVSLSPT